MLFLLLQWLETSHNQRQVSLYVIFMLSCVLAFLRNMFFFSPAEVKIMQNQGRIHTCNKGTIL